MLLKFANCTHIPGLMKYHRLKFHLQRAIIAGAHSFSGFIQGSKRYFEGTLFRLAFRTRMTAEKSGISNHVIIDSDMMKLKDNLMENAQELLLFTKNVNTLKVYTTSVQQGVTQANLVMCSEVSSVLLFRCSNAVAVILRNMENRMVLLLHVKEPALDDMNLSRSCACGRWALNDHAVAF